jgi:hypothetical protein
MGSASRYLLGAARSWRACSAVALAFCLFRVFLCRARVLCAPDLTVALLGIETALAAVGAVDGLVCAGTARGANASAAAKPIKPILLTIVSASKVVSLKQHPRHRSADFESPATPATATRRGIAAHRIDRGRSRRPDRRRNHARRLLDELGPQSSVFLI